MADRRPALFAEKPVDPRARDVVAIVRTSRINATLELACGHSVNVRTYCTPARAICTRCPSAGGLAGNQFGAWRLRPSQQSEAALRIDDRSRDEWPA